MSRIIRDVFNEMRSLSEQIRVVAEIRDQALNDEDTYSDERVLMVLFLNLSAQILDLIGEAEKIS
ncbi:hypothetical protein KTQ81_00105 [Salmonella enterica subsp. diarizonae]|uniref:hypothetical protein n=1 Tax=Salmonella enterica TaxID=28901 RepID=UPI001CF3CD67|nr:hypothetical protein [Salmonella enterica subsp. diarizonae]